MKQPDPKDSISYNSIYMLLCKDEKYREGDKKRPEGGACREALNNIKGQYEDI